MENSGSLRPQALQKATSISSRRRRHPTQARNSLRTSSTYNLFDLYFLFHRRQHHHEQVPRQARPQSCQ